MDLSGLGFWLSVAALLLMVPASVVANTLTPRVQAWWARTSKARARRRIPALEKKLRTLEFYTQSPFSALARGACCQSFSVLIAAVGLLFCLTEVSEQTTRMVVRLGQIEAGLSGTLEKGNWFFGPSLFVLAVVMTVIALYFFSLADSNWVGRLKDELRAELSKLKEMFPSEAGDKN